MNEINQIKQKIKESQRLAIKVGSNLLIENGHADQNGPAIRKDWLRGMAQDILALRQEGREVILVSSGAIAIGCEPILTRYRITKKQMTLPQKQAAAAYGQAELIGAWQRAFYEVGGKVRVAQHLLTHVDMKSEEGRTNAKNTINVILESGGVPIINENDTVATKEITFGDNDTLSGIVSPILNVDTLILFSYEIDGLYQNYGTVNQKLISHVQKIDRHIWGCVTEECSSHGTGGAVPKICCGQAMMDHHGSLIIAYGNVDRPFSRLMKTGIGTLFCA